GVVAAANYEGVSLIGRRGAEFNTTLFNPANQENPKASRGASEIKRAEFPGLGGVLATIEPWHGNQVVVYTRTGAGPRTTSRRVPPPLPRPPLLTPRGTPAPAPSAGR